MSSADKLTITGHLNDLRRRLIHSVIALIVATAASFFFAERIFQILIRPAPAGIPLIYTDLTEMVGTYMKVCLTSGVILAMPFFLYEIVMFVAPGLTRQEKKYVLVALPWMALMFLGGVAFGYFILVPPAVKFLLSFGSDIASPMIKISNYMSVMTRLLLAIGAVFETPVIIVFLSRIGVCSSRWLASKRKYAFVGAFIISAIITPTIDPINQSLVAGPLIVLFELSIWLSKLFERRKPKLVASEAEKPLS